MPLIDVVGQIYASVTEPHTTGEVLALLNGHLRAACTRLVVYQPAARAVLHSCISGPAPAGGGHDEYLARWHRDDPLTGRICGHAPGEVLRCHEHFDEEFVASNPFFQEHLLVHGWRWTLCGLFDSDGESRSVLASLRPVDEPPFDEEAAATLRSLLPHFRRAARLRASIDDAQGVVNGSLDLLRVLPTPWMLTDRAGRCIESGTAFQPMAAALGLKVVLGRLRLPLPEDQARWEGALFETDSTALGRAVCVGGAADACTAHLIPWRSLSTDPDGAEARMILVVFERTPSAIGPDPRVLALKARLTRAELEVFGAMLQGSSAKVIAKQRGASFNTIRSQIVRILGKTGHHSQRELIASFGASVLPDSAADSRDPDSSL